MSDRFLDRWSRRKSKSRSGRPEAEPAVAAPVAVAAEPDPKDLPPIAEAPTPVETAPADEPEMDAAELTAKAEELGLPDPNTLGPGDDFSAFLSGDVPKQLRNLAMRRLWRSNPVLANVDGLVDYGEDFTDAATVVANLQTAYQVGRGYKRPEPEEEADEVVAEADAPEEAEAPEENEEADPAVETEEDDTTAEPESRGQPQGVAT